ncbi:MAG: hypothetical protein EOP58_07180 [Sphingomonadales bacterium]|nr:MAG: hypothetical protein EOP58_07180 [Sphingomonadales bacterium]
MILAEGDEIQPRHLLLGGALNAGNSYMPNAAVPVTAKLPTIPELVHMALDKTEGDEKAAAKMLGCDLKTVLSFK